MKIREMNLSEPAVRDIATLAGHAGRPEILKLDDGSERAWILDPAEMKYAPIEPFISKAESVSNVESLAAAVEHEFLRMGKPEAGRFMTVSFTQEGGTFDADVRVIRDDFTFKRKLSPQFELLMQSAGKPFGHVEFLRLLQALRPSIPTFKEFFREFRKINFNQRTEIVSAPIVERGEAGSSISIAFEAKSTGAKGVPARLPGEVEMVMAFARGSDRKYKHTVEIEASLEGGPENPQLKFRLVFVDRDIILEKAVDDEIEFFKKEIKAKVPELLVLRDF